MKVIATLICSIAMLATIVAFWRISKPATYLLIPYILWVSFAIALNAVVGKNSSEG